jgi:hypothetical protein
MLLFCCVLGFEDLFSIFLFLFSPLFSLSLLHLPLSSFFSPQHTLNTTPYIQKLNTIRSAKLNLTFLYSPLISTNYITLHSEKTKKPIPPRCNKLQWRAGVSVVYMGGLQKPFILLRSGWVTVGNGFYTHIYSYSGWVGWVEVGRGGGWVALDNVISGQVVKCLPD